MMSQTCPAVKQCSVVSPHTNLVHAVYDVNSDDDDEEEEEDVVVTGTVMVLSLFSQTWVEDVSFLFYLLYFYHNFNLAFMFPSYT